MEEIQDIQKNTNNRIQYHREARTESYKEHEVIVILMEEISLVAASNLFFFWSVLQPAEPPDEGGGQHHPAHLHHADDECNGANE